MINLDKSTWKQILGQKMEKSDLENYEFVQDGLSEAQIEERIHNYFSKFSKQIKAI